MDEVFHRSHRPDDIAKGLRAEDDVDENDRLCADLAAAGLSDLHMIVLSWINSTPATPRRRAPRDAGPTKTWTRLRSTVQTSWPPGSSRDRKSTRLNSSHLVISYAVFC